MTSTSPFFSALTCACASRKREVPFHALDVGMLAAGGARRRLAARHVLGVLDVHRLVARLELVALEHVRARADVLLDLLVRVGLGDALGHDERHVGARLAERLEHEAAGLAQEDAEGVGRRRIHALHELHQRRAHRIALAPALQRGDHVLAGDRLAVVELQALAQLEGPQPVVAAFGPALDHLRLDLGASRRCRTACRRSCSRGCGSCTAVVQIGSRIARLECGTTRSTLFCACAVPAISAIAATAAAAAQRFNVVAIVRTSDSRTLGSPS